MTHDDLRQLLQELVERGASELHIKAPGRPLVRVDGRLIPTQRPQVSPQVAHQLATGLLNLARVEVALVGVQHHEFSFGVAGLGRFHVQLYRQRGSLALCITRIQTQVPSLSDLEVPAQAESAVRAPGLTLICGDRRRTQILAALVGHYNATAGGTVIVLEDPLSHLHRDVTAIIAQRGVGTDVSGFGEGIDEARRLRVDLIAAGDLPDRDSVEAALRAAEAGISVVACVAAPDPNVAASWLLRHYASDRDMDVKQRVKRLLVGVICAQAEGPVRVVNRRSKLRAAS